MSASLSAFWQDDPSLADDVAPLEEVIDRMKDTLRDRHIARLQQGHCSIEAGFIFADLLTNLERISDHCCNIADCIRRRSVHSSGKSPEFQEKFQLYAEKYLNHL